MNLARTLKALFKDLDPGFVGSVTFHIPPAGRTKTVIERMDRKEVDDYWEGGSRSSTISGCQRPTAKE